MRPGIAIATLAAAMACLVGRAQAQDVDLMQYADTDMDGKVTMAEFTAFSEQAWSFLGQGADKVKVADLDANGKAAFGAIPPDADGNVTKDAYIGSVPARFKAADKNGDGVLNAAELNATMKPPG